MPPLNASPRLLVIAGPTAGGKSKTALRVAEFLDGEIINADSVQVYRYFDIGSAKPSEGERRAVPHHCIDIAEPDEPFSMAEFRDHAGRAAADIASRGKTPIVCGGSGLYIKALLEGLSGGTEADPELRRELLQQETPALYERLRKLDPARAGLLHPNDRHRVIRGLENALLRPKGAPPEPKYDFDFFVLAPPRSIMYRMIEERVDTMLANGMVEETQSILDRGFQETCKPFQSVGYRQAVQYLRGGLPRALLAAAIKQATRNYAKRQVTWFSRVGGAVWLNPVSPASEDAARIMAEYYKRKR